MFEVVHNARQAASKLGAIPRELKQKLAREGKSRKAQKLVSEAELMGMPPRKADMVRAMGLVNEAKRTAKLKRSTSAKVVEFFSKRIFK